MGRPLGTTAISNIRLPWSANRRRGRGSFLKLLSRVDPDAQYGFGFEGSFLRPGGLVTRDELRPTPDYPATAVLLECALTETRGIPGNLRCDGLYILWTWDEATRHWRERARAVGESWEWAVDLRPMALRALREARGEPASPVYAPDLPLMADEISRVLDENLKVLTLPDRRRLLGILHDQFATRLCA